MEDLAVKRYLLLLVACVAAGLASGQTMEMHRYYGAGPYVSPPYWKVPDLTQAAEADAATSPLDITKKAKTESAYPDLSQPNQDALRGEEIGRRQSFSKPRTYVDHSAGIFSLSVTRSERSARRLDSSPSAPSQLTRSPSYRTFEYSKNRSGMHRYMNWSSSYRPR